MTPVRQTGADHVEPCRSSKRLCFYPECIGELFGGFGFICV